MLQTLLGSLYYRLEAPQPPRGSRLVRMSPVLGLILPLSLSVSSSVLSEIFPYLVVVIGLENVLVLTKSVVSTPVDLEVKLRIAQGNTGVMGCSSYIYAQRD